MILSANNILFGIAAMEDHNSVSHYVFGVTRKDVWERNNTPSRDFQEAILVKSFDDGTSHDEPKALLVPIWIVRRLTNDIFVCPKDMNYAQIWFALDAFGYTPDMQFQTYLRNNIKKMLSPLDQYPTEFKPCKTIWDHLLED